jgi:hypothetical protein
MIEGRKRFSKIGFKLTDRSSPWMRLVWFTQKLNVPISILLNPTIRGKLTSTLTSSGKKELIADSIRRAGRGTLKVAKE